jgi:hypothetical protein
LTLTVGFKPDQPQPPVTTVVADSVVITWVAPNENGTPITSYRVAIRQKDNNFSEQLDYCDGSQLSIVEALSCSVPLATIRGAPFSLEFGDSIFAKVVAINYYGESASSDEGNNAIVLLVPDAPTNLQDNVAITSASIIGLQWTPGMSTGGTEIIDYRVSWDQSTDTWAELEAGVTTTAYITKVAVTPGKYYKFKVEARNSVGYSLPSTVVEILCA